MMRTLVIGGTGHLGGNIMDLANLRHNAWGTGRKDLDVTDPSQNERVFNDFQPTQVINTVCNMFAVEAEAHPGAAMLVMGMGQKNVVDACAKRDIPVVYISSDYVFSGTKKGLFGAAWAPYDENDLPDPINAYGSAKAFGEVVTMRYSKGYVARIATLFGAHSRPSHTGVVDAFIRMALDNIQVSANFNIISPTYGEDAAMKILELFNHKPGVYHCTNTGCTTIYDLARYIYKYLNSTVEVLPDPITNRNDSVLRPPITPMMSLKLVGGPTWKEAINRYLWKQGLYYNNDSSNWMFY
jgi:dTDP-4-dehydrorhamnose reductase